jgi:hypothetical protein
MTGNDKKEKQLREDKWRHALQTFYETRDMLGDPAKQTILRGLEREYHISFSENGCSPPERIESALRDMLGAGAQVIIGKWKEKLG